MIFAGRISQRLSEEGGVSCSWVLWLGFYNFIHEEYNGFQNKHFPPGSVTSGCHSHLVLLHMMEHDITKQLVVLGMLHRKSGEGNTSSGCT